jgi:hypothetical protein
MQKTANSIVITCSWKPAITQLKDIEIHKKLKDFIHQTLLQYPQLPKMTENHCDQASVSIRENNSAGNSKQASL